jgi:hypothetical protein
MMMMMMMMMMMIIIIIIMGSLVQYCNRPEHDSLQMVFIEPCNSGIVDMCLKN